MVISSIKNVRPSIRCPIIPLPALFHVRGGGGGGVIEREVGCHYFQLILKARTCGIAFLR